MPSTTPQAKKDLIQNIIFGVSQSGAFQRNKIYKNKLSKEDAIAFKKYLKSSLAILLQEIKSKSNYSEEDHYVTISTFAKRVSKEKQAYLHNGKITIGTAQKLINLYWKMSWLLQTNIPKPAHCPFDGIIIKGLGQKVKNIKWTKMDSIREYKELVKEAKIKSGNLPLADWELIYYNIGNGIASEV